MSASDQAHPLARAVLEPLRQRGQRSGLDVPTLTSAVESHPEDLEARARLLGALAFHRTSSRVGAADPVVDQALWWLEHHPDKVEHLSAAFHLLSRVPLPVYERLRDAWDRALGARPEDPGLLIGAAVAAQQLEPGRAVALLQRACAVAREDPRAPYHLGQLLLLRARNWQERERYDRNLAGEALEWFEMAIQRATQADARAMYLCCGCEAAFGARQYEHAKAIAVELLKMADAAADRAEQGNSIYTAHFTLGLIALAEGDVERAKAELLLSGQTPGSPNLNSFGPDLDLARELLLQGEHATVLAFLRSIARFWKGEQDRIDYWCFQIEHGKTPTLERH